MLETSLKLRDSNSWAQKNLCSHHFATLTQGKFCTLIWVLPVFCNAAAVGESSASESKAFISECRVLCSRATGTIPGGSPLLQCTEHLPTSPRPPAELLCAVIPQQPQAQPLPSRNPPARKLKRGNKNYYPCVKEWGGNGVWLCGSRERELGMLLLWLWIDETFWSRELWDCKSWS